MLIWTVQHGTAQADYPKVIQFEHIHVEASNEKNNAYHFLMLSAEKGVDLTTYAGDSAEFALVFKHKTNFILSFNDHSNPKGKGRCAAGEEKGFLFFNISDDFKLVDSKKVLLESCLWGYELVTGEATEEGELIYNIESYINEDRYQVIVNELTADLKIIGVD